MSLSFIQATLLLVPFTSVLGAKPRQSGLSSADAETIVRLHNKLRVQEKASNMQFMRYNQALADMAQQWTDRCEYEHGYLPFRQETIGFSDVGQNMFFTTNPFRLVEPINDWYGEKKDFDYDSRQCTPGETCLHYSQVVWAATTDVGCGMSFCPSLSQGGSPAYQNAYFFVCNYGPRGNMYNADGSFPLYLKGLSCTQCNSGVFYCHGGLCDSKCNELADQCTAQGATCNCRAKCKNGAKTDRNSCTCSCAPGWTGTDCSAPCQDMNTQCGDGNGWPQYMCNSVDPGWIPAMQQCPLLCGKCVAKRGR